MKTQIEYPDLPSIKKGKCMNCKRRRKLYICDDNQYCAQCSNDLLGMCFYCYNVFPLAKLYSTDVIVNYLYCNKCWEKQGKNCKYDYTGETLISTRYPR